ncbi:MAG: TIGR03067 domain-containing protein [Pirellulaceae bacterium]|nr:TIGR03067 domain-containing protein [Pirellulaceae bacterium]
MTEKLQGRWEIVAGVSQGRELGKAELKGTYMTVTNNKMVTYDADEQQRYRAVFSIIDRSKPIEIMMTALPQNPLGDKTARPSDTPSQVASGILKFTGKDRLVLCYSLPGSDRPKKFASPKDSTIMLFKMQRQKSDPQVTTQSTTNASDQ